MTHFGPWAEDPGARFTRGPMARPGTYNVRLTAGDDVVSSELTLVADPRVLAQGTTLADIDDQVAFELVIVDLLSDVRRFGQQVAEEQETLEASTDELSPDEASRLLVVTDTLDQVRTADIIYPQPMLEDQVNYLYNMVNKADQTPGVEAADRYAELAAQFARLSEQYESDR
jgi:hypothetical protein